MPEQDGLTFPKKMYNDSQDVIEADCQETLDLALSRGWKLVPAALNTIPLLKAKVAEVEAELKELKENLKAKIHENEVAMKAEEILEKMRAEKALQDEKAQAKAEKQAAKEEAEAEKKDAADAKAAAEAEVAASGSHKGGPESVPAPAPESGPPPASKDSSASKIAEHLRKK
jgi:regulator of protease activity HflC (stomatin/prohibitin superfamily)